MLRTWRLGESDRIVNLLTPGRGKVRAVAKGVRKTKSRFGGRLEPMVPLSLLLYEGRELDIVTQAETLETSVRSARTSTGWREANALLEAVDQVAQERHANARLYQMLLGALRALAAHDAPLLVPAFFLKLLALEGFHPCSTPARRAALRTSLWRSPWPGRCAVRRVLGCGRRLGAPVASRAWTWSAASWAATWPAP